MRFDEVTNSYVLYSTSCSNFKNQNCEILIIHDLGIIPFLYTCFCKSTSCSNCRKWNCDIENDVYSWRRCLALYIPHIVVLKVWNIENDVHFMTEAVYTHCWCICTSCSNCRNWNCEILKMMFIHEWGKDEETKNTQIDLGMSWHVTTDLQ